MKRLILILMMFCMLLCGCVISMQKTYAKDNQYVVMRIPASQEISQIFDYGSFGKYTFYVTLVWSSSKNTYVYGSHTFKHQSDRFVCGYNYVKVKEKGNNYVIFEISAYDNLFSTSTFYPKVTW